MPTPEFRIRRLAAPDLPTLRALNAVFAVVFEDEATFAPEKAPDSWLERLLGREHVFILVAEDEGDVVGGLVAYALDKHESARTEVYIYDLGVLEAYRRRGVATALIEALKPLAREQGAWVIFVQADYGDEAAIALYTRLGTREDVMHFDIPLD